jgi:hypothetical protein
METKTTGYISVIGFNLIEPILELVEQLETIHVAEPNEVKTGERENGFSCGIIALSVFLFESAINRTKYIRGDKEKIDTEKYFLRLSNDKELSDEVDEIIAVRDAIVHNHLWEANVFWDGADSLKFSEPPKPIQGYGNKRRNRVMNVNTRLTYRLGLNLFPSRIWRRDTYIVLGVIFKTLVTLETIDHNYFTISNRLFKFSGEVQTLQQIIESLPTVALTTLT